MSCFFHLTLFTSTNYTLDIFSDTKPPNGFFGSFVALGDSLMTMMNYFQNLRLQDVRNDNSTIIHQESFRHRKIRSNGIQTMGITWEVTRFCWPTINCEFHGFLYPQIFISRLFDLIKTNVRYGPRSRDFVNIHSNFFYCSLIFFVTRRQRIPREGISDDQLLPGSVLCFRVISHHSHKQSLTSYRDGI